MKRPHCKQCKYYGVEVAMGDGEPLEDIGRCPLKSKMVEWDDLCNDFKLAKWVTRKQIERSVEE
jgi:hypothetical protein